RRLVVRNGFTRAVGPRAEYRADLEAGAALESADVPLLARSRARVRPASTGTGEEMAPRFPRWLWPRCERPSPRRGAPAADDIQSRRPRAARALVSAPGSGRGAGAGRRARWSSDSGVFAAPSTTPAPRAKAS